MQNEQELYKRAVQHYQQGDLSGAEGLIRQILMVNAQNAPALHLMGIIGMDVQRYDMAEELVRAAIALQINNPSFYFTLGRVLARQDKKEEAADAYRVALKLKPDFPDASNNLGTILLSLEKISEAKEIFEALLRKNPNDFNALSNLGSISYQRDKYDDALAYYHAALLLNPDHPELPYDIALALVELNRPDEALPYLQKFLAHKPDHIDALLKTGNIYRKKGNLDEALACYTKIKSLEENELAYVGIASTYIEQKRFEEALLETELATKKFPESARLANFLGSIYDRFFLFHEALASYERSIELDPTVADTYSNKANTLKQLGHLDLAIESQKKAISVKPLSWIYSNALLTMHYASSVTPEDIADLAKDFGKTLANDQIRKRPFKNDRDPDRKLRIGYVSPDFRNHAVRYFLSPLFYQDKKNFEVFAYSKTEREDFITDKIKAHVDHWRDIRENTADEASDLIEKDQIDILVDLAGHTGNNGLMIFARKPAPIQVTWLGFPATTGMAAMDYKIADPYTDPVGLTEHLHTEELWRLPEIFCAYTPHDNSPNVRENPPFEDNGFLTLGCLNSFAKVSDPVLATWAKILDLVPNSKLLLEISGIESDKIKSDVEDRITGFGIAKDRLILHPYRKANQYVLYNQIDLSLDPFPAAGGTTSMDTLWMGVPFVTLAGKHFGSRMGVTILTNVGMPELIAANTEEYIKIAADLANDRDRLKAMRHKLRERVAASPLMDQKKFAHNMEDAYRAMWRIWTEKQN